MTTIQQQITNELAGLRTRQLDESPEIKLLDCARTHARINQLLDQLDALTLARCGARPTH